MVLSGAAVLGAVLLVVGATALLLPRGAVRLRLTVTGRGSTPPTGAGGEQGRRGARARGRGLLLRVGSRVGRAASGAAGAEEVAQALAEVAALLRAGAPAAAAWSHPARQAAGSPGGRVLAAAAAAASAGGDVAAVLQGGASTEGRARGGGLPPPTAEALRAAGAAWRVSERCGAPAADVLDRLVVGLRADADARDARDAALAAPRATARLLVALPGAGLLLGSAVGAAPVQVLLDTWPGRVSALVGTACTAAGWAWTRALVRAAERSR